MHPHIDQSDIKEAINTRLSICSQASLHLNVEPFILKLCSELHFDLLCFVHFRSEEIKNKKKNDIKYMDKWDVTTASQGLDL